MGVNDRLQYHCYPSSQARSGSRYCGSVAYRVCAGSRCERPVVGAHCLVGFGYGGARRLPDHLPHHPLRGQNDWSDCYFGRVSRSHPQPDYSGTSVSVSVSGISGGNVKCASQEKREVKKDVLSRGGRSVIDQLMTNHQLGWNSQCGGMLAALPQARSLAV